MQLNATEQKWFDLIQAARSSGLSDRDWCQQNSVPASTFYYHIRKLRDKVIDLPAARSTVAPEVHEVVKVEVLDENELSASSNKKESVVAQDVSFIGPRIDTLEESCFCTRIQADNLVVDFSNRASEQIVLSVIRALRQTC